MEDKKTEYNFMRITHGLDNYEELINLREVIFIRACWEPVPQSQGKEGDWSVEIVFRNGHQEKVRLTEHGWQWLVEEYDAR
jgi:hypothetical protein